MSITEQQLQRIMPNARRQAGVFVSALNVAMTHRQVNTPKRQAAFLAQVGHESGQLQYVRELGGEQYLSKCDTGSLAARLGNTPEVDGDGQRYRGRCLIQITGHFWWVRELNALADRDEFEAITRKINDGLNGLPDRLKLWAKALTVLA